MISAYSMSVPTQNKFVCVIVMCINEHWGQGYVQNLKESYVYAIWMYMELLLN
jgi:hypothetical protein